MKLFKLFFMLGLCFCHFYGYSMEKEKHAVENIISQCDKCHRNSKVHYCARCNVAKYCSFECQVADWPEHEQSCMIIAEEKSNNLKQSDSDSDVNNLGDMLKAPAVHQIASPLITLNLDNMCQKCYKQSDLLEHCDQCIVKYCSKKCKELDWDNHRHSCQALMQLGPALLQFGINTGAAQPQQNLAPSSTTEAPKSITPTIFDIALFEAASQGNTPGVQTALDLGADANIKMCRATPLVMAAAGNHEDVVRLLLKRGANLNAKVIDPNHATPLLAAAQNGHECMVKLLLDEGAYVDAGLANGSTPLHVAAGGGYEAIVLLLLKSGADVNAAIKGGKKDRQTPLFEAARNGHEGSVKLLLDAGADVNVEAANGSTPLHVAGQAGHKAIVLLLLERGARFKTDILNDTWSYKIDKDKIIALYILYGAVIPEEKLEPIQTILEETLKPIEYAACFYTPENFKTMLSAYDSDNLEHLPELNNALMWAAGRAQPMLVNLCLEKRAQADQALTLVTSILLQSTEALNDDYKSIFTILLESMPKNEKTRTLLAALLKRAVISRNVLVARLLVEHNAPVDQALIALDHLLMVSTKAHECSMLTNLYKFLLPRSSLTSLIMRTEQVRVHKQLVEACKNNLVPVKLSQDIASIDIKRYFSAIKRGAVHEVEMLFMQGIDPNATNNQGKGALELAVDTGNENIVKLLLNHPKIIANPKDAQSGVTLLDRISKRPSTKSINMLKEHILFNMKK